MAVADSVKTIEEHIVRRIHSRAFSGRLYKNAGITAATASIPSKYQTLITDNSERKGFGRCAKRFDYDLFADENPGPGTYIGISSFNLTTDKPSFSKKGTGGFASKDRRIMRHTLNTNPGAGTYDPRSEFWSKKDFSKSNTSAFATPIVVKRNKITKSPAPNTYEVSTAHLGPKNNVCAIAAFKSMSTREDVSMIKEARCKPAPGHYNISDNLLHQSVKVPYSSFKSTSIRKMSQSLTDNPGPGTYSPENPPKTPVNRVELPRKHYLCLSAPAMPLPPSLPGPGPGSYNLVDYQGEEPLHMSGAVFLSNTSRWTDKIIDADLPGPAHYHPSYAPKGKQSFIYNAAGRWI